MSTDRRHLLSLVGLVAVVLAGCAATGAGGRSPGPPHTPVRVTTIVVTRPESGRTIEVRVGQRGLVELPGTFRWHLDRYPSVLRLRSASRTGTRFPLEAVRPGRGEIRATGAVSCRRLEACPGVDVGFAVTVTVR